MHDSILLVLWAGVSFILYRLIAAFLTERRHRNVAEKLGCEPAYQFKLFDIQGIRNVTRVIKADKEGRVTDYLKGQIDDACALEGRNITSFDSRMPGSRGIFTVEPKNIQAVLATQFKEFGLGERRNINFSSALGKGIVGFVTLLYFGDDM